MKKSYISDRLRALISGLLLACAVPVAQAQSVIVHGVSHHTTGNYNNSNWGAAYRTDDDVVVGAYRNSEGTNTAYAAYVWQPSRYFGVAFGGALGYRNAPVMPVVMPTFSLPLTTHVALSLGVMPMYSDETKRAGLVFHSMLEISL